MNNTKQSHLTIIYVNFSPYENAGKILDYILLKFRTVLLFSFNFHHLGVNQEPSTLRVYRNGKTIKQYRLFQTATSPELAFVLLPIRSIVILLQIIFHAGRLYKEFGPYDIYFTVNAFTAWTGNLLRSIGLVKKTIFWVWDYYPPVHKSKITMFMRWLYWIFDKPASLQANKTVFLNKRLEDLRKQIGILPKHAKYPIISIGTTHLAKPVIIRPKPLSLVFLGVLKKSQGLDLLFDASKTIMHKFPHLTVHIIGGGPDSEHFMNRAKQTKLKVIFHGYVPKENMIEQIMSGCHIGLATYIPEAGNVSYYSDPSKIKKYISLGLPVITTNVFEFSKELQKYNAGIVLRYYKPAYLVKALIQIQNKLPMYRKGARSLAKQYYYEKLYRLLFTTS